MLKKVLLYSSFSERCGLFNKITKAKFVTDVDNGNSATVVPPYTAVLGTGVWRKPAVFRNGGIGREYNPRKVKTLFGTSNTAAHFEMGSGIGREAVLGGAVLGGAVLGRTTVYLYCICRRLAGSKLVENLKAKSTFKK